MQNKTVETANRFKRIRERPSGSPTIVLIIGLVLVAYVLPPRLSATRAAEGGPGGSGPKSDDGTAGSFWSQSEQRAGPTTRASRPGKEQLLEPYATDGVAAGTPIFSPDSKRMAYAVGKGRKWIVLLDGNAGKEYDAVQMLAFSPDSKHFAYAARDGKQWRFVVDGKPTPGYVSVGGFHFGNQPGQYVYATLNGNQWSVVSSSGKSYSYERVLNLTMSPDRKHIAWAARRKGKWFVVLDGVEQEAFDAVGLNSLIFSPDSDHLAYAAQQGKKWRVVVDGSRSCEWDRIGSLKFSPGSSKLVYAAITGNKWFVSVIPLRKATSERGADTH